MQGHRGGHAGANFVQFVLLDAPILDFTPAARGQRRVVLHVRLRLVEICELRHLLVPVVFFPTSGGNGFLWVPARFEEKLPPRR